MKLAYVVVGILVMCLLTRHGDNPIYWIAVFMFAFTPFFYTVYKKRVKGKVEIKDTVAAFGETIKTQVPVKDGVTQYCHKCLEKMAIQCAWCKKPIFIGDPITLYTPSKKDFQVPEHAAVHNKNPLQLVGCLRWECADTGADRAGFWLPPGKVHRVMSPIEMAMQSGGSVSVGNVSDPKEAVSMQQ